LHTFVFMFILAYWSTDEMSVAGTLDNDLAFRRVP
jgi:hypothetical protein